MIMTLTPTLSLDHNLLTLTLTVNVLDVATVISDFYALTRCDGAVDDDEVDKGTVGCNQWSQ